MNAFADVMFSLLLGWLRGFIGEIWALVTSGAGEGFMSWIGGNWLWIVVIVCLIGTVIDYIVWFARWRPDKLWRARLHALRMRGRGEGKRTRRFNRGYREGIQMDWLGQQEAQGQSGYAPGEYIQEAYAAEEYPPEAYDPRAAYAQSDAPAQTYDESLYRPPVQAEKYAAENGQPERRRRADKRAQGARRAAGKFMREDEDDRMIDGLPPLVDKEQAYHTPVYPGAPARGNAPTAPWEDSDDDNG